MKTETEGTDPRSDRSEETRKQWRHDFECPSTHCKWTVAVLTTRPKHLIQSRPYCQHCGRITLHVNSQAITNLRGQSHEISFPLDVNTLTLCKGALAVLTQNKTYKADIDLAKSYLKAAIENQERT